jgi:hypothetical protein
MTAFIIAIGILLGLATIIAIPGMLEQHEHNKFAKQDKEIKLLNDQYHREKYSPKCNCPYSEHDADGGRMINIEGKWICPYCGKIN